MYPFKTIIKGLEFFPLLFFIILYPDILMSQPVIGVSGFSGNIGCNPTPTAIISSFGTASLSGGCPTGSPTIGFYDDPVLLTGCQFSQTRTFTATDGCGNQATPVSVTVNWIQDSVPPVIYSTGTTDSLPADPNLIDINDALGFATTIEDCSIANTVASDSPVIINGNMYSQTRTWFAVDACGNSSIPVSRTVVWTVTSGIEEGTSSLKISTYPNPTEGLLTIEYTKAGLGQFSISIINPIGQEIHNLVTNQSPITLDIEEARHRGIYFLKLTDLDSGESITKKILLQ